MTVYVSPIVEGETEKSCVKKLLSRVWREWLNVEHVPLAVLEPIITKRSGLAIDGHPELSVRVRQATADLRRRCRQPAGSRGFVLILIDADEDCPATLGRTIRDRACAGRADIDVACVLAKRELENWFKAAAASLGGVCGLPDDLTTPPDPETGSGDKWLAERMVHRDPPYVYLKTVDAIQLVSAMDLGLCHENSPSFRKLCRELGRRIPLAEHQS